MPFIDHAELMHGPGDGLCFKPIPITSVVYFKWPESEFTHAYRFGDRGFFWHERTLRRDQMPYTIWGHILGRDGSLLCWMGAIPSHIQ